MSDNIDTSRPSSDKPEQASRRWLLLVLAALAGAALMWVYPGPQYRAEKARQEQAWKEEWQRKWDAEQAAAQKAEAERRAKADAEFAAATPDQLRSMVEGCQTSIREKLAGPFEVYFTRYTAYDLEPLKTASIVFGKKMGRPSTVLDDYSFDPIAHNLKRLQDPMTGKYSRISFVIEHAADGFSIQQYVAVWECDRDGLKASEPRMKDRVFF